MNNIFNGPDGYVDGEEPVTFYYNRQRRLENAPKIVKEYYENGLKRPKGFFGVLFAAKGNKFMFIAMLAVFAMAGFFRFFGPKMNEGKIADKEMVLKAVCYEDQILTSLKITPKNNKKSGIQEDGKRFFAVFKALDRDGTVVEEENISALVEEKEIFLRTTFKDYDIMKVETQVSDGNETVKLVSSVAR